MASLSMSKKINLLILALLLVVASSIILLNTYFYRRDIRAQVVEVQLPLMSNDILNNLDVTIMEPSRGLAMAVLSPSLQDWIRQGEPNAELGTVYRTLESIVSTYHTLGANFVSQGTRQYTDLLEGKRSQFSLTPEDTWFEGFRDSNLPVGLSVYVNDKTWGTKAFINRRVDVDGKYAGLVSVSIDLKAFVAKFSSMTIGKQGVTFIADPKGIMRFTANQDFVNKPLSEIAPAYAAEWQTISNRDSYQFTYKNADGDLRYVLARKIPVLGWFLCTEASDAELMQSAWNSITISVAISLVLAILGSFLGLFVVRSMVAPLRHTADFAEAVSRGDLNKKLDVQGSDEIGVLASSLTHMVDALKQKISQAEAEGQNAREQMGRAEDAMRQSSQQEARVSAMLDTTVAGTREASGISEALNEVSRHLGREIEHATQGAAEQYASVGSAVKAVGQMVSMLSAITAGTGETAESVETSRQKALEGEKRVGEVIAAIQRVSDTAENMKSSMNMLEGQTTGIARILETISDIADQTNLLALNAAIEAARAGDAGRGFAVVADEVRKLAEKTMQATKDVSTAISSVQLSARQNLENMGATAEAVEKATLLAGDSGKALHSIVALSEENAVQVNRIADTATELARNSSGINSTLDGVNTIAMRTRDGMKTASDIVQDLIAQASRLDALIVKLKGDAPK